MKVNSYSYFKMNIFKRFRQWREHRKVLKMIEHTIIMLNAFNYVLSKQGVGRAVRHRYMRAVSQDPKSLLNLYYEIMGPSDGRRYSRVS